MKTTDKILRQLFNIAPNEKTDGITFTFDEVVKAMNKAIDSMYHSDYDRADLYKNYRNMIIGYKEKVGQFPPPELLFNWIFDTVQDYRLTDKSAKNLIREIAMRQHLAFPETEQDLIWSEQKPDGKLMARLFEYLDLGDGIEGDIRNNSNFWRHPLTNEEQEAIRKRQDELPKEDVLP